MWSFTIRNLLVLPKISQCSAVSKLTAVLDNLVAMTTNIEYFLTYYSDYKTMNCLAKEQMADKRSDNHEELLFPGKCHSHQRFADCILFCVFLEMNYHVIVSTVKRENISMVLNTRQNIKSHLIGYRNVNIVAQPITGLSPVIFIEPTFFI